MRTQRNIAIILSLTLGVLGALPAAATTVLKMDMDGLTDRADRIFRGTVLSVEPGSASIGGGDLPTITYRFAVGETFKGEYEGKEGVVVEMTVLGDLKEAAGNDGVARLSSLPQAPRLARGNDYVIFATQPSAAVLSTAVGLGQGAFKVYYDVGPEEMAVNELGNLGLFDGPVTYTTLAATIRAHVGE